jgi:hypothetical protein
MTTQTEPRVRRLNRDEVTDPRLLAVLDRAEWLSTPRPA